MQDKSLKLHIRIMYTSADTENLDSRNKKEEIFAMDTHFFTYGCFFFNKLRTGAWD